MELVVICGAVLFLLGAVLLISLFGPKRRIG